MKNKTKQVRAGKQPKSLIPKGIKSFTEKPGDQETSNKEAFELFNRFTAEIIKEEKIFLR
jgi:hypothetical protein